MKHLHLTQRCRRGMVFPLELSAAVLLVAGQAAQGAAVDLPAAFQTELDALRDTYGFPGATAAYVARDGATGRAASGVCDIETGTPMPADARMLSASIGKTYVSATVLALADEGVLDLDCPVSRWIGDRPWFSRVPNHDTLTLRHLLTHRAGLPDHVHLAGFAAAVAGRWREPTNPFLPEALVAYILDMPPLFAPGKGWAYSDTGYILIGLIIEAATGRRCCDEITARFLNPLGLTQTTPSDRRALPGLVAGYVDANNPFGFPPKTTTADGALAWHPGLESTGGGWITTAHELARWGAALFGGTAMQGDYLGELLRSAPIHPDTPNIHYGAGVAIYRAGPLGPAYGHSGWIPGYVSSLRHYPQHGVTIAFQVNTDIAMLDASSGVMQAMERRLARIVILTPRKKTS